MYRFVAQSAFRQSRRFLSSNNAQVRASRFTSRFAFGVGISAGLAGALMMTTSPLLLDAKKEAKKEKAGTVSKVDPESEGAGQPAKEDKPKTESTEGEGEGEGEGDEPKQQSAYNPETGEINWDCPCLGGMANGPCGEEFKAAFSCFVYSEAEPKGIDCVEKFRGMQDCFRKYPEIYSEEIRDDETPVDNLEAEPSKELETGNLEATTTEQPGAAVQVVEKEDVVERVEIAQVEPEATETDK